MHRRALLAALTGGAVAGGALWWWPGRWRYIVVHHSAGRYGDIPFLTRVHRERHPDEPTGLIPYHFLIGNGNGLAMGEVARTERWRRELWGAHVRGAERNLRGIGICLIGNYQDGPLPEAQYGTLVALTRQLAEAHAIPPRNITLHGETPGQSTLCPGRHFPRDRFHAEIRTALTPNTGQSFNNRGDNLHIVA